MITFASLFTGCVPKHPVAVSIEPAREPGPPIRPFEIAVELTDGDQVTDSVVEGVPEFDADRIQIVITNTGSDNPDITHWEIGLVRAPTHSWTGEDCTSVDGGGICHTLDKPVGVLTLDRVATAAEVVDGSTFFFVDFPESNTPTTTYVLYGYDMSNRLLSCYVYGDQTYYSGKGCNTYTPAG